jgi:hypothetical protein
VGFDIYFAGSQNKLAEDYMMNNGCNRLLSYYSDKSIIKSWVDFKKSTQDTTNKLFIDCGAYTAFTQGVTIDIDNYIQYINNIIDYIDIFASLDIIGGGDVQDSDKKSYDNYLYIKEHCKGKHKLLPTYHQGDDIQYLYKYLEDDDIDYIALGGLVGSTKGVLDNFFQTCYKVIQKVRPGIKVHAFGMTSKPLLKSYPFKSADSTAWIMTSANGGIMSPWGVINISEKQDHLVKNYANMRKEEQEQVQQYLQSLGFTVQQCMEDYKIRCLVNIMYLQQFADNHERKLKGLKKSLF